MTGPRPAATVLITGGTGGLGRATATAIAAARRELTVVLTGRDASAAASVAGRISAETGGDVRGLPLDLGSLDDVRRFGKELVAAPLPPLHAVLCNAGTQSVSGTARTADGFERTFGVNHLAHFLLVRELLPHLVAPARIVFVASGTHDPAKRTGMPAPRYTTAAELADPAVDSAPGAEEPGAAERRAEEPGAPGRPAAEPGNAATIGRRYYTTSKLCNVLTTYELARRLPAERPGELITVNAFDP
ncbi:MAG TPA: SDR family NAD(P)-dependent oxidoreductase, partial [Pseudonocardia sp.]|nr:SDR family NAD(P)-dependent oxidoreductase [Pseudonocardia sp.]